MSISSYIHKYFKGDLETEILDAYFLSDDRIHTLVSTSDIVGIGGTTPQCNHIQLLAKRIKESYPNIKIAVGGYGPSLEPFKFLNDPNVDHLVVGEGEESFLKILKGVTTTKLVSSQPIADINTIPNPDRDNIDLEQYISIAKKEEGRRVTSILTERGCAFGCTFCAEGAFGTIWRKADLSDKHIEYERPNRYRERDPYQVAHEMYDVKKKFDIEFFKMNDAETNPTRMHFLKLCQAIHEVGVNTTWGCNMRCDKVDDEICMWARKAGCVEFWMGLESGSPIIHKHINKGTTVPMIRKAFQCAKRHKILTRTYTLLGTSPESYDTIKETESLIDELDPDIIGFSILCPYPGTSYWKKEYEGMDWESMDEYSNTLTRTDYLTNEELRAEQARLIERYQDKLASIVKTKIRKGIISGAPVLDSMN